jgi:aminoglycoside phosphotransferase (APT) family kinase protein
MSQNSIDRISTGPDVGQEQYIKPGNTDFSVQKLGDFLREKMTLSSSEAQAAVASLERISGGQSNPTYFLTVGGQSMVLRKAPTGDGLPGAHAVDREFRVLHALRDSGVPVPKVFKLETDTLVLGAPFYLMERVSGIIEHRSELPDHDQAYRGALYRQKAHVLGRLHAIDPDAVGLKGFGKPGNFFERQISRWSKQWDLSKTREIPEIDELIPWLRGNTPADETLSIVHGDYRIGNMIIDADQPRVNAVLDWELSTLGHPMADLAHTVCLWFIRPDEYGGLYGCDLPGLGIPSPREFVDQYNETSGRNEVLTEFHLTFAIFRMAVIFEGIAARAKSGTASADNAEAVGRLAPALAKRAADFAAGKIEI